MVYFWISVLIILVAVEAFTVGLVSIWFAVGSLFALIAEIFGASLWMQIVIFTLTSAAVLYFIRPLAKKYVNPQRKPTNADRLINMPCMVTEVIDNINNMGAVSVGGKIWTARSVSGDKFEKGEIVRAVAIDGVKLIVSSMQDSKVEGSNYKINLK